MEHSLRFEELNLTKETVYIEMGYGAVSPDKNVRDLVDNLFLVANNIVRPRFYFRMFDGYVNKDCICCNQKIFHVNQTIATLLKNSERFVFFAATAGMEYQDFHNKLSNADDALLLFIWDILGSCIAEATGDIMEKFVETELPGIPHTNRFSPGYCGWHVNE